jgi:hypothetical protein
MRTHPGSVRSLGLVLSILGLLAAFARPSPAAPSPGFREDWPGASLEGWGGGSDLSNPGTGGADGAGDGYLVVSTSAPLHLGAVNTSAPYPGNWTAAGITLVKVSLNDVGVANPALSIHLCVGNAFNFWECNTGFHPPLHQWAEFSVDLTASGNFTRIIGSGTFAQALANVDRILFRHDLAPYMQSPDSIQGDFGMDRLILTNPVTAIRASTWGRIKNLYR